MTCLGWQSGLYQNEHIYKHPDQTKETWVSYPGPDGKTKCHVMHVGKRNNICPKLEVHGTTMQLVTHDTYLDDVISADGSNTLIIKNRLSQKHRNVSLSLNI